VREREKVCVCECVCAYIHIHIFSRAVRTELQKKKKLSLKVLCILQLLTFFSLGQIKAREAVASLGMAQTELQSKAREGGWQVYVKTCVCCNVLLSVLLMCC